MGPKDQTRNLEILRYAIAYHSSMLTHRPGMTAMPSLHFRQSCGIACHQVDLDIDLATRLPATKRCHAERVRDDQHGKRRILDRINGERNAIQRDRPLGRDETSKSTRDIKLEPRHIGQILAA